jgi:transposase
MSDYKVIGLDLAKRKFHLAAINFDGKVILKKALSRNEFFNEFAPSLTKQTFAFEACSGCHNTAQQLIDMGHEVIILKTKDVKPYAKSRQKNDINDSIAICKAACDVNLMRVQYKTKSQQEVDYFHKSRQNTIQQRIQRSNSLMNSLQEFGYIADCGKTLFAKNCVEFIKNALDAKKITLPIYEEMLRDCEEIQALIEREKALDKSIQSSNKSSAKAQILMKIPGIGPINASVLANKTMETYETPRDFAASLGLVPKQSTTGGRISLGGITKQGDRYARTMLIQAGRALVMRVAKDNPPQDEIYKFIERLKKAGKCFNIICVAVANKLARIAYSCVTRNVEYVCR